MRKSREALAKYLGTGAENLIYAQNVTIAMNIVVRSLELGTGDETKGSHQSHYR